MDTTSLSFYGEGGETLGGHGYSKDFRPDLKQMILGLVVDCKGRPICTEMWPGNTVDVKALLAVIDRLRQRFAIGRICMVADRGMISAETVQGLEERQLDYVLGARERTDALVRTVVLNDSAPFTPLLIERAKGQTQLFVKDVKVDGKRYIVCRNETEAEKDKKDREAIVVALQDRLKRGDKALIGNSSYRRYLRKNKEAEGKQVFEIDAGKLADEAQFDGIFVLRTNAKITPLQAVLRCRDSPAGGGPLPAWQGPHADAPSLPLLRRRHSRPRILHLPGARHAEASRRSRQGGRRRSRMARIAARSGPAPADTHSAQR